MCVSNPMKNADHRSEARHPVARERVFWIVAWMLNRTFSLNGERITEPLVHPMADQSAADIGIDRIASRGNPFQLARPCFRTITTPMRRLIVDLDVRRLACDLPIKREVAMSFIDAGHRLDVPLREQAILAIESAAADDQLVNRLLDPFDLTRPVKSTGLMLAFVLA